MSSTRKNRLQQLGQILQRIRGEPQERTGTLEQPAPAEETDQTFLIVGLGNPGREYVNNRHNIGFMVLDRLAETLGLTFSRAQHRALVSDARHAGHRLILAKPQTYMNESGQAVAALVQFYKIPLGNLLVVFDDMDLPYGTIRIRKEGGSGGQKGMKSIIQRLGNRQDFPRIRVGIGRPPGRIPPPKYLLQDFSYEQQAELGPVLDIAEAAVFAFVTDGVDRAMNRYNGPVAGEP